MASIAPKIGCTLSTLLMNRVKCTEVDSGQRPGVSTQERERIKAMEREINELHRAGVILKLASAFSPKRSGPQFDEMKRVVSEHRHAYGTRPICKVLQVVPSRRAIGATPPSSVILGGAAIKPSAMRRRWSSSSACLMRTGKSTVHARFGLNCIGRASGWLAAWPD